MSVKRTWERIEAWLLRHAPEIFNDLRGGASAAQVCWVEAQIGHPLPEEVKESYAVHDGHIGCGLMEYWDFYSLGEVVESWRSLKATYDLHLFDEFQSEPIGPIRTEWWHPLWIPITGEPRGDHFCLDLAPMGGHQGQVISWIHDDSVRELVAPTFGDWLRQFADALEAGAYKVDCEACWFA